MCGILGSINFAFDSSHLDLIKHRGPDDSGMGQFSVNRHSVIFAQRRLSIIDLSPSGHQPMVSPCGRYSLIFNGEIYNHLELRSRLPGSIEYKGHSDTETILYCLMHFGIEALKEFNGIFALAFLDSVSKNLYIARDPLGVKPLYYHASDNKLLFSSEIRAIKALLGTLTLKADALASLLRLRFNPSPDTLFTEISKLGPGQYIRFGLDSQSVLQQTCYFSGTSCIETVQSDSLPRLVERYGEELDSAVERQMLSDVEIGVLLSGGIDSAMIAALAQKHSSEKLKAFTIGFGHDYEEDEIADAAETARILGMEHHVRKMSFSDFLSVIRKCTNIVEEPLATTSIIPMYFLSELASAHVKVVLTGQGADEPLGGYARYKAERYRGFIPRSLRKLIKPAVGMLGIKNEQLLRASNSIGIEDQVLRFLAVYGVFSPEEIHKMISVHDYLSEIRLRSMDSMLPSFAGRHSVEKMMAIDTRMNLSDDLLNYTDKITMNFSMECRVPMLDLELVKFIESLPVNCKIHRMRGKHIHKEFAKRIIPDEIVFRKKKGFYSPTKRWFLEEIDTIRDILLSDGSLFSRIFNQRGVKDILDQHAFGLNKEKQIFLLLSIFYWLCDNPTLEAHGKQAN